MIVLSDSDKLRFLSKVSIRKNEDCWPWTASTNGNRMYGKFKCCGKWLRSNRVAWIIANNKDIPEGLYILHKCDNPICCNPDHLYLGTPGDNNADRERRNRAPNSGRPRSVSQHLIDIVNDLLKAGKDQYTIAYMLKISQQQVSYIANIERYRS
jgi:hypothetical protein